MFRSFFFAAGCCPAELRQTPTKPKHTKAHRLLDELVKRFMVKKASTAKGRAGRPEFLPTQLHWL